MKEPLKNDDLELSEKDAEAVRGGVHASVHKNVHKQVHKSVHKNVLRPGVHKSV